MLVLRRFKVSRFRSVKDSGWIDTETVTSLVGTNESGKTNLLVPLWKLNPAKGGEIDLIADFPRSQYNQMRNQTDEIEFIRAEFEVNQALRIELSRASGGLPPARHPRANRSMRFTLRLGCRCRGQCYTAAMS